MKKLFAALLVIVVFVAAFIGGTAGTIGAFLYVIMPQIQRLQSSYPSGGSYQGGGSGNGQDGGSTIGGGSQNPSWRMGTWTAISGDVTMTLTGYGYFDQGLDLEFTVSKDDTMNGFNVSFGSSTYSVQAPSGQGYPVRTGVNNLEIKLENGTWSGTPFTFKAGNTYTWVFKDVNGRSFTVKLPY